MAIAPTLTVQKTKVIIGIVIGKHEAWGPQKRYDARYDLGTIALSHWIETLIGDVLTVGMLWGVLSLWLLLIAASLIGAVGLSLLSSARQSASETVVFPTPFETDEPDIVALAQACQKEIAQTPFHIPPPQMAAE